MRSRVWRTRWKTNFARRWVTLYGPWSTPPGVILHTNLGRAPLGDAAIKHIRETAASYSNLEFDLGAGERGKRDVHVDRLFRSCLQ